MDEALRVFLTGLIDYAGLFPPAKLDLRVALQNYLRYMRDPDRFMLGRFICPASCLEELAGLLESGIEPVPLSVILDDADAFSAAPALLGAHARIEVCEGRSAGPVTMECFREFGFDANWRETLPGQIADLPLGHGLKIRCGGLEPGAFPSTRQLAGAIRLCLDEGTPFKATAGLHHPVRHRHETIDVTAHGFLNVFGAGVLAWTHDLPEDRILRIIEAEDPGEFTFRDGVFAFGEHSANAREVTEARRSFARSFGSCSFDEPREDLRALGLMS